MIGLTSAMPMAAAVVAVAEVSSNEPEAVVEITSPMAAPPPIVKVAPYTTLTRPPPLKMTPQLPGVIGLRNTPANRFCAVLPVGPVTLRIGLTELFEGESL